MKPDEHDARIETEITGPLREAHSALDELHRARLSFAIETTLDREDKAMAAGRASRVRRRRVWLSASGIAAAIVVGAVFLTRGPHAPPRTGAPVASAPETRAPPLLVPYHGAGERVPAPSPTTSLLALAGERVRATVGTRVRLTLVGPGRVSVLPAARVGDVELALNEGRLLVDYDGHAGGMLSVGSPGAVTTVVGTLFAVEATGSSSRVAVARGRVRTTDSTGHLWQVAAGDSWTSADGRLAPISDELAAALVRHEADWTTVPPVAHPDEPIEPLPPAVRPSVHPRRQVKLDALYAKAEAAMRAHAIAEACRILETIVDRDRNGPLGETALLDLARLALADGDRVEARRALARLPPRLADPALAETASHLRCRAERVLDDGDSCGF